MATSITPLPKLQIGILFVMQMAEPIAATVIFPFIAQASPLIDTSHLSTNLLSRSASLSTSLG